MKALCMCVHLTDSGSKAFMLTYYSELESELVLW